MDAWSHSVQVAGQTPKTRRAGMLRHVRAALHPMTSALFWRLAYGWTPPAARSAGFTHLGDVGLHWGKRAAQKAGLLIKIGTRHLPFSVTTITSELRLPPG